jgi:glycine/D-amino acid oxidase-like deaminating enzyme
MYPFLNFDNARFPIKGGLLQRRGGTVRHDAVAWGYARGADQRGVDIIQNCEVTGMRIENGPHQGRGDHARLHRRGRWRGGGRQFLGDGGMAGMRCRSKAMCCRPSSPKG